MKRSKGLILLSILILFFMYQFLKGSVKRGIRYLTKGNVTKHFKWAEFDCKDGTAVPVEYEANVLRVAKNLEVLREALGGVPIRVNSGYRTPLHNQKVGGVKNSRHLTASAADIYVKGFTPKQVFDKILELIRAGKMEPGGVGLYETFVHYDIGGVLKTWKK